MTWSTRIRNVAFEFGLSSALLSPTYVNTPVHSARHYHTSSSHRSWNSLPNIARNCLRDSEAGTARRHGSLSQPASERSPQLPPPRQPIPAKGQKAKAAG